MSEAPVPYRCLVMNCQARAVWQPELNLWAEGHPKVDGQQIKAVTGMVVCDAHRHDIAEDFKRGDVLGGMVDKIIDWTVAMGRKRPDRASLEVRFQRREDGLPVMPANQPN